MSPLLKVAKIAITRLSLGLIKPKKNSRARKFIGTINLQKICSCSSFGDICVTN